MRDKRPVDELSIEELERILAIRKREARQKRLRRLDADGRRLAPATTPAPAPAAAPEAAPVIKPPADSPYAPVAMAVAAPEAPPARSEGRPQFEDELAPAGLDNAPRHDYFWRMVWNRSLLLIEVVAVIGLVYIGVQMVLGLQSIQTESAAIQQQAQEAAFASIPTPTITPEITLNQVVLPGGHTPPTSPGGAQFNFDEIPAHLRPVVQQQVYAQIAIPTPSPTSPIRIEIPAINVDAPIVSGTSWEALRRGVGHQDNTGMPGQRGNVVLAAHNDIFGEIFRYLDQLSPGDEVIIHTQTQRYVYVVQDTQIVQPEDTWVMDSTHNPTTTLISCYPYQVDNQRIVVFAQLQTNL